MLGFIRPKKVTKSKSQLLKDYREYKDLGITFDEYLEYIESDDHIDIYIYLLFFAVFIGLYLYKKFRERRLRMQGRP